MEPPSKNPATNSAGSTFAGAAADDPAALQKELAESQSAYLRLAADFANFKRRATEDAERRAGAQKESFIRELLPVLDNLERALASGPSVSVAQMRHGVGMTLKQLRHLLRQHGIEAEKSVGQHFDPHRHEAIAVGHDPSQPDQTVLKVTQRGYRRDSQIFRPAKVVVNHLTQNQL